MREGSPLGVRTLLGISVVLILGAAAMGCEAGRVLGDTCTRDDECVTGVCAGARCRAPVEIGTQPVDAALPPDAAEEDAAAPDAGDAASDVAPDAEPEDAAAPDVEEPDAEDDANPADAAVEAAPSDGGADA